MTATYLLEQRAEVVAVENGQVRLQAWRVPNCSRCAAGQGCGNQLFGRRMSGQFLALPLPSSLVLSPGDVVVIAVPSPLLQRAAMALYGLPLLALLLAAALATRWSWPEPQQVAFALGSMVLMLFGIRPPLRRLNAANAITIVRKLPRSAATDVAPCA